MDGRLDAAIESVLLVDPKGLSDAELDDALMAARRAVSRLEAGVARLSAEWDRRQVWAGDGSRSAAARLARDAGVSPQTAHQVLERGRRLDAMPETRAALAEGTISADQADLLATANQPEIEEQFARDEHTLVENVSRLRYEQAKRHVRYWINRAREEADATPGDPGDARHLEVGRDVDGCVEVRGSLDPVSGTAFTEELRRLEQALYETDVAAARERMGNRFTAADLRRTPTQRRADALVEMAKRSSLVSDTAPQPRPLISVLCGYDEFAKLCQMEDGTVVSAEQLLPHLSDSDIQRAVFDSKGQPIELGVRERYFTGPLRRLIELRDQHCTHTAGCDVPASQCHIDHIEPYSEGGLTVEANGRCYCPPHNLQRNREGPPDTS